MNEQLNERAEKLEHYLNLACDAEANGDRVEAERQFRRALCYEGKLRSDVTHARDYAEMVGPVYPADSAGREDNTVEQELGADTGAAAHKSQGEPI